MHDSDIVLSVSAGRTSHLIEKYRIHAYPARYGYRCDDVEYFTYRASGEGGIMRAVFCIAYHFQSRSDAPELLRSVAPEDRDRVTGYVKERRADNFFIETNEPHQFFVLAPEPVLDLPHKPAVKPGARGACYYTLNELLSGSLLGREQTLNRALNASRAVAVIW